MDGQRPADPESYAGQVIADSAKTVADYRSGKRKALDTLVGQMMRLTGGQGNPTPHPLHILEEKLG